MPDLFIIALIAIAVVFAIKKMRKSKGGCAGCPLSENCAACKNREKEIVK